MARDEAGGGNTPQHESKHPEEWSEDLEGDRLAGQNVGPEAGRPGDEGLTAGDIPELREKLTGFRKDELDRIPIVPEGQTLRQGASYLDLGDAGGSEFTATGEMTAGSDQRLVDKQAVDYEMWNRLTGR